jgi:hypothetical protein
MQIEIYWKDLTKEKQESIKREFNIKPEDWNWDTFPMFVMEIEPEAGGKDDSV